MNAYFFNVSQAEKNDILDQHKKIYDGFVTSYGQQINQQPLYVQDYANDKEGFVVNNKGVVKSYTNMGINEANAMTGSKYIPDVSFDFGGPDDQFEKEYDGFTGLDMIGDSDTDMEHGTYDDDEEISYVLKHHKLGDIDDKPKFKDVNLNDLESDVEDEIFLSLQEQVNKTLDMFKRFKNY
jgi:hypothetical protein